MSRVLAKCRLVPHPHFPTPPISLGVKVSRLGSQVLKLEYVVVGDPAGLRIPAADEPLRTDGLWEHTCFEAFLGLGAGYLEYNVSPSRRWAIYRFEDYRSGMVPAEDLPMPDLFVESGDERFALTAFLDLSDVPWPQRIGVTAVIEATDGSKSFWALRHPPGKPDFHHRDCFALELPAPSAS